MTISFPREFIRRFLLQVPIGCQGDECHSPFLAGVLDSGTSCIVLPDSAVPGMIANQPFTDWKRIIGGNTKAPKVKDSFFINIAGREYEIPYDVWYITQVPSRKPRAARISRHRLLDDSPCRRRGSRGAAAGASRGPTRTSRACSGCRAACRWC